jgi:hypothetical protein
MLTIRNSEITTINRDAVNVGGHEIPATWDQGGATINRAALVDLRRQGLANWSNDEIEDLAYHAETRLNEAYTKAYEIGVYEGFNADKWHVLASIRVANDAEANAYAEQHFSEHEWFILDSKGENING